jgi:ABC-type cobalamin/Fe3+-siderophores transport system ATPase subunit
VSVQAEILNLLRGLRTAQRLTIILVSHNLAVIAHMCDRLAVMNEHAAELYFTTFTRLDKMLADGAPLHPETLIAESLQSFFVRPLVAEFNSLRMDGTMTPFDPTVIDIADYARSMG